MQCITHWLFHGFLRENHSFRLVTRTAVREVGETNLVGARRPRSAAFSNGAEPRGGSRSTLAATLRRNEGLDNRTLGRRQFTSHVHRRPCPHRVTRRGRTVTAWSPFRERKLWRSLQW